MGIKLDNLQFSYNPDEPVLKGISLGIEGTEPVAIIGQNGAGKTTLVKHFNGILRPTDGEVLINGISVNERSTADWSKEVGYVFQNPDDQLFLETVEKEFEFGPRQIGMSQDEIKERVPMVADLVGLGSALDKHPFDLTPTEKKFCTIGAVIMMNPQVIVFDEPTCGQDRVGNERLATIISELRKQGKLCITISHDMKFVASNFSRVIVLCQGQVLMDDDVRSVFSRVDELKQSFVTPPPITRVAQQAGMKATVFSVPKLIEALEQERNRNNHG